MNHFQASVALSLVATLTLFSTPLQADESLQACLLKKLSEASDDTKVSELKAACKKEEAPEIPELVVKVPDEKPASETQEAAKEESHLVKSRMRQEYRARNNRFAILPHKPNYILPVSYNDSPNEDVLNLPDDGRELDEIEVKFQVSFKTPIWDGIFGDNTALFFAYTGQSYWQAYNSEYSSPFRETNHQPEFFAQWVTDWKIGDWQIPTFWAGIEHQSNGRSGLLSRSWNRIYTQWVFEKDRWVISFKPWWRIPEDEKDDPFDAEGDDNPDIDDYMGYFELQTRYQWNEHNFGIMLRNNLRSDNRGATQFDWTFPLDDKGKLRGYIQLFNGYGESLIDYNRNTSRIGVGILLTDWL
ncbi:phospholipase A [Kangiella sp. TOML190]|uniref:phospholipase A n=1 Tax=Kangiella sp. TOML190 TaxID=2931351 RepID=UPI00203ACB3B|nr:phospholipase A [Kangiella sp. TOML190]